LWDQVQGEWWKIATEAEGSFWKMELAAMDHLFN